MIPLETCFDFSCSQVCCLSRVVVEQGVDFSTGGGILLLQGPRQGDRL